MGLRSASRWSNGHMLSASLLQGAQMDIWMEVKSDVA